MYNANLIQQALIHICITMWSVGAITVTQLQAIVHTFYTGVWG